MFKKTHIDSILSIVDSSTIYSIVLISTMTSILFLVIPVAAQTLVNFIAFGHVLNPVFILSIMVFVLILSAGALSLWHNILIEIIQQKLMVKVGILLTRRFSDLSHKALQSHDGQKEVNKFFDIVVVMKATAGLLLYGVNITLQIFFGLVLLVVYHPYFVIFDILVLFSIFLVVALPFRVAKKTAEEECAQKHSIAEWFDEIVINRYLFKFGNYSKFVLKETDNRLVGFLKVRNRHFRQLIKHQLGFYAISAVASALLLGLGGYLVISDQLSLGQLVASEIIMAAIAYALKQSISILDDYYDLNASLDKFDDLFELPIEGTDKITEEIISTITNLETINLTWHTSENEFAATPKSPLLVHSLEHEPIHNWLVDLIGLTETRTEKISLNGVTCNHNILMALRKRAILLQEPQCFSGTIYENIVLNTPDISMNMVLEKAKLVGLSEKIMSLPNGLLTIIDSWNISFTETESVRLMILRALINNPSLIIIDRTLDSVSLQLIEELLQVLLQLENTTILITSKRTDFPILTNKWVFK
ncbi:MAG: ABC transporter ATP-binding protein [Legionellaceae bacterium]|nr:ABC transporter ATP-binding protein [Legionellaceae bacterium]